ncbi:hypothetical protein ACRYCC_00905 [Actinomadura scrupuli]|uniref:hypothetical protein n=1 Tax=Actinomadura scrupuli TaxID=559629 RepID=UPI003D98CC69
MVEIPRPTLPDGVDSAARAAFQEYVERRDSLLRTVAAQFDSLFWTVAAECESPQARATWWDSFFRDVTGKADSFFKKYGREGAWRSVRRDAFGQEYDAADGNAGPDRNIYIWARELSSYEEIMEAVAELSRLDEYACARRWGGASHDEALEAAAKLGPLEEYETARRWGGASHQEIMEAVAEGVRLPAYAQARCGAKQRSRHEPRDTSASHEEVMEIHALGLNTAGKLRAYVAVRVWASHMEVKEAIATGGTTVAFLRAYAKALKNSGASHGQIMEALAKGEDLSVLTSQQG